MSLLSPLDSPIPENNRPKRGRATRIAFVLEILFWAMRLFAAFLILESWEGGTELVIISTVLLSILYWTVPYLIMGSRRREENILSYGVGGGLGMVLFSGMLRFASWPGSSVFALIAIILVPLAGLGILVSLIKKPARWSESTFYKHALLRWCISAWSLLRWFN